MVVEGVRNGEHASEKRRCGCRMNSEKSGLRTLRPMDGLEGLVCVWACTRREYKQINALNMRDCRCPFLFRCCKTSAHQ